MREAGAMLRYAGSLMVCIAMYLALLFIDGLILGEVKPVTFGVASIVVMVTWNFWRDEKEP